jgi:putative endonuclease
MDPARHLALGESGEDLACAALARRGYAILERRYRTKIGEIDIIARDGDVLVFVEVKARRGERAGSPAEAITVSKRRRLALMASDYLARRRPIAKQCRFDVVAVTICGGGAPDVAVIPNAFSVGE